MVNRAPEQEACDVPARGSTASDKNKVPPIRDIVKHNLVRCLWFGLPVRHSLFSLKRSKFAFGRKEYRSSWR